MRLRLLALVLLPLAWAGPVRGQEVKRPADVLPATTLLYADVRQPGALAKEIGDTTSQRALILPGDVSKAADVEAAVNKVVAEWGRLDIVFANAGANGVWAPIDGNHPPWPLPTLYRTYP